MFKNYLKIAVRNLLNQKLFSFINILSLTVGITCSILLGLYIHDELSFDKFNTNRNSIYRVLQVNNLPDGSLQYEGIHHAIALGPAIVRENPKAENYVRFFKPWDGDEKYYIKQNGNSFHDKVLYGDFNVFDVFSFPLLKGSIETHNLNSVAISERAAKKYFGEADPVNQTLSFRINNQYEDFIVTAVFKNIPSNSSVQFDVLLPFNHIATVGEFKDYQDSWGFGAIITYVKLRDGTHPVELDDGLKKIMATHYPQYKTLAKERGYASADEFRRFRLEPVLDVHFNAAIFEGLSPSSDPMYSYILMILVIGILSIACFNFMNLSISRSTNRMKEVGLRKAIGALRKQLITQFLGESILLSLLALSIALLLVDLLLPAFNYLVEKQMYLSGLFTWKALLGMIGLSIAIGIIAGFYPAFVISRFNIRDTLSRQINPSNWFTKTLVTLQFTLSALLIIGMIVISKQVNFLKEKDLGFDSNQVLVLNNIKLESFSMYEHLQKSTADHSGIQSIASASQTFANPSGLGGRGFTYKGESKRVGIIEVDGDYIETLGIKVIDGRKFLQSSSPENAVIINEACMKDFELTTNGTFEELTSSPETDPTVVGIMGDFNYSNLKMSVFPMLIRPGNIKNLQHIFIKIKGNQTHEVITFLEKEWKMVAPDLPFEYTFLDDTMAAQYSSEEKWESIMSYSTILATILSCLGLLGIVALGMETRKKEIGIRKILGAQVQQIMWFFTSKYLQLVMIAFLIATPVSYLLITEWLSGFAYRIEVDATIFITAGLSIILVSAGTIGIKIFNAALRNPIEALRIE
ncbi:MAG: ABC transporter permease [Cyclobacteriaceae bacterium]|jgi:putative ABC transport system permease protein|nr:ABC transporter permease [Cyclobacteriaceae bacterium]